MAPKGRRGGGGKHAVAAAAGGGAGADASAAGSGSGGSSVSGSGRMSASGVRRVLDGFDCSEIVPGWLYMSSIRLAHNRDALHAVGITHIVTVAGTQKFPNEFQYIRCYAPDSAEVDLLARFAEMKQFVDDSKHFNPKAKSGAAAATPKPVPPPWEDPFDPDNPDAALPPAAAADGDGAPATDAKGKSASKAKAKAAAAAALSAARNPFAAAQRAAGGKVLIHCRGGISRSATLTLAYAMASGFDGCDTLANALEWLRARRPIVRPNKGFMAQLHDFEQRLLLSRAVAKALTALAGPPPPTSAADEDVAALDAVARRRRRQRGVLLGVARLPGVLSCVAAYVVEPTAVITRTEDDDDE